MLYLLWKGSLIFVTITTVVILEIIISLWHCIKNQIEDKHKWIVKFATKRTANHFQIHSMHGLDDCKSCGKTTEQEVLSDIGYLIIMKKVYMLYIYFLKYFHKIHHCHHHHPYHHKSVCRASWRLLRNIHKILNI